MWQQHILDPDYTRESEPWDLSYDDFDEEMLNIEEIIIYGAIRGSSKAK